MKPLKTVITFLGMFLFTGMMFSCGTRVKSHRQFMLLLHSEALVDVTQIYCDSFQMVNTTKAYFWVDGNKNIVAAKEIMPDTNMDYYRAND
jgi:hypothetical protein